MISIEDLRHISDSPLHAWLGALAVSLIVMFVLAGVHRIGARIVKRIASPYPTTSIVLRYVDKPSLVALALLGLEFVWLQADDGVPFVRGMRTASAVGSIASLTWLLVRLVAGIGDAVIAAHPIDTADNLHARGVHTQARVLARTVMAVIVIVGTGAALMTFPNVRQIGASLLASAGVAGLVAGIAARPVLGNLIAGLQIALTQPIRLDDVVVIQGEWGRIEEITGTYVSVRLWDQRRLIVPLQWFIENPFANWTRNSSQIIGTVFLFVDYRMPLAPLRDELARIVGGAPEWDGRVQVLQVTDTTERTMQLRVLVSAADSSQCWDLRCRVREGLITYIQTNHPQCLPRSRTELFPHESEAGAPSFERSPMPMPAASSAANTAANTAADPKAADGR
ncbi:mechanosensitive ion channel family protein [Burkholderia guangdongensis]|uniref:mechanosensitive ion channel family protein n=1 Tax=Burkholderia guangdongensis TaxID=1792500 RepID=UPI0015CBAA83|nr:mechanosensitive ion channel domain-containing protein [Burkholderia guangdongensis]